MKMTIKKIKELCTNLEWINAYEWNWDYDLGTSFVENEHEVCVYDDSNQDYYFNVKIKLWRDYDGELKNHEFEMLDVYDSQGNTIEITDKQSEIFLSELIEVIN